MAGIQEGRKMSLCFVNDTVKQQIWKYLHSLHNEHTYTQGYKNDFINFTYFIVSIARPICGHAGGPGLYVLLVIHDSQSVYAVLTFSVFTFPNGFIISLWKKKLKWVFCLQNN